VSTALPAGSGHTEIFDDGGEKRIRFSQPQEAYTPAELRAFIAFLGQVANQAEQMGRTEREISR
jgi:hypothetical protein